MNKLITIINYRDGTYNTSGTYDTCCASDSATQVVNMITFLNTFTND